MSERVTWPRLESDRPVDPSIVAGVASLLVVGSSTLSTALANAPLSGGVPISGALPSELVVATFTLAALVLAAGAGTPFRATTLSIVGVFSVLAAVFDGAIPAAIVAVAVCGVVLAVATERPPLPMAVLGTIAAALFVSLLAVSGVVPAARAGGTWLFCLGLAGLPALATPVRTDWLVGAVVAAGILLVGTVAPFVSGAVLLIAGGVVGAPIWIVALAAAGATVAIVASLRERRYPRALGGGVLLLGGVPASLPAALAAILGLALLTEGSG